MWSILAFIVLVIVLVALSYKKMEGYGEGALIQLATSSPYVYGWPYYYGNWYGYPYYYGNAYWSPTLWDWGWGDYYY